MHALRAALAMGGLCGVLALPIACGQPVTSLGLSLYTTQGLLDDTSRIDLKVVDAAGLRCDTSTGTVTGAPSPDAEIQDFPLSKSGCTGGASWCQTITLDRDGSDKLFQVTGYGAVNTPTVQGCAIAAVDQDPLQVPIQVYRFVEPRCCNDGRVQPTEQCDTGVAAPTDCAGNPGGACIGILPDFVCECDCLAKEILLSRPNVTPGDPNAVDDNGDGMADNVTPPAISNNPGSKEGLALAFSGSAGQVANSLRAVFTDFEGDGGDIDQRILNGSLYPLTAAPTFMKTLRLPVCGNQFSTFHRTSIQKQPAAARVSDSIVGVVFANSEYDSVPNFDVAVNPQGPDGCADSTAPAATRVNATHAVNAGACEHPAIAAGANGRALIVWNQVGKVRGRIWDSTTNALEPAMDIEIADATPGTRVRVAGNADHWVVVHQGSGPGDLDGVFFTFVQPNGTIAMPGQLVNVFTNGPQVEPDVAMLPGGEFLVVWNTGGAIVMQRFAPDGSRLVATDQDAQINLKSPPGMQPAVASGGTVDSFYAVVWAATDGTVWGRLVDGSQGFRLNNVTGQNDDFLASHPGVPGQRFSPDVAVGGDGFIAIGWLDNDATHYGMWARRFPLPEN